MGDAFARALDVLANPTARPDALLHAADALRSAFEGGAVEGSAVEGGAAAGSVAVRGSAEAGRAVIELYERAAAHGIDEARTALGMLFVHGAHRLRIPRDEQRGLGALRAAALAGRRDAIVTYVRAAHAADTTAGRRFHADAADMLNRLLDTDPAPDLLVLAAWMLQSGHGYVPDPLRARALLERAAAAGDADALFELAVYGVRNIAGVEGGAAALARLRAAAERGHARAMANLGGRYATGDGVVRDMYEAVQWYQRAAAAGNARAAYVLAVMFDSGRDVQRDAVRAAHYREAAGRLATDRSR